MSTLCDFYKKNNKGISALIIFSYVFVLLLLIPISLFISNHYLKIWQLIFKLIGIISLINGIVSYLISDRKYNKVIFMLIIALLLILISCFFSKDFNLAFFGSMYRQVGFLSYLMFFGIFLNGINLKKRDIRNIAIFYVVVTSIICIISMLDNELTDKLFFSIYYKKYEFSYPYHGPFYNANHFGYYLTIPFFIVIALYLFEKNNIIKIIYLILFNIISYTLIINNTFGAYLGVFISFLLLTLYVIIFSKRRDFIIIFFLFLIHSLFIQFNGSYIVKDNFSALFSDVKETIDGTQINAGTSRINIWKGTIEYIKESPLIGYGAENVEYEFLIDGVRPDSPHNIFLELASYFGIPVAMIYLIVLLYYFVNVVKKIKKGNVLFAILFLACLAYFISSLFGNVTFYVSPYYIVCLGILLNFEEVFS